MENSILLIEDDDAIRESLEELLSSEGYSVITASNGQEAIDAFDKDHNVGLLILDMMMPVMNGWEFLLERGRRDKLKDTPIIILSAMNNAERVAELYHCVFMKKPLEIKGFLQTVRDLLSEPRVAQP